MHNIVWSLLVVFVFIFHIAIRTAIKNGKVRVAFCAHWCVDAIFAIGGAITCFSLYQYDFTAFWKLNDLLSVFLYLLTYLIVIILVIMLAPSGRMLLRKQTSSSEEAILLAEYSFNDTLCMLRNFFLALLFIIPVLVELVSKSPLQASFFHTWSATQVCGGFCFMVFLILLPISLRQSFFWLKALADTSADTESPALKQYIMKLHYRQRNWRL